MNISFLKENIIKSALSPFDYFCVGYPGKGNYLTGLVMGIGVFKKTFSHPGSKILDEIVAYDRAEISEAYMGQINMTIVSSFIGPQGLIWGYDIAKKEDIPLPSFLLPIKKILPEIKKEKIEIKSGENLRKAMIALLGTSEEKHFPFLPGTHVSCAGRFYTKSGPANLYGAVAIGIPHDRKKAACVIMEDIGEIRASNEITNSIKRKIMLNAIRSIYEIGKNQKVNYKEIFIDFIAKKIETNEIGCILVNMPYFLLAKKALTKNLINQNLEQWATKVKKYFLCNQQS